MHGLLKDIIPLEPVNLLNNQNDNFALKYINDKTHYKKKLMLDLKQAYFRQENC